MASSVLETHFILRLVLVFSLMHMSLGTRKLTGLWTPKAPVMDYHNGEVLTGCQQIIIVWYGRFTPTQRGIICDFINSLSSPAQNEPSVNTWFSTLDKYYALTAGRVSPSVSVSLLAQHYDKKYSHGKSLTQAQIQQIALSARGKKRSNVIVMVLTAADVNVEQFCMICGNHASCNGNLVYLWVGNSANLCPGQCAWPFHPATYGPPLSLVPPNNDTGIDGMVINIASLLAGCITNPYGTGIFEGVANAPREACSACPGIYGPGAYPGNPGQLMKDQATNCSHNTYGINDRKYLVPAMFDPATLACLTLV